jgi:hypothetical protein
MKTEKRHCEFQHVEAACCVLSNLDTITLLGQVGVVHQQPQVLANALTIKFETNDWRSLQPQMFRGPVMAGKSMAASTLRRTSESASITASFANLMIGVAIGLGVGK